MVAFCDECLQHGGFRCYYCGKHLTEGEGDSLQVLKRWTVTIEKEDGQRTYFDFCTPAHIILWLELESTEGT